MPDEWEQWMQEMKQQGYTRHEIREYLQEEGYDPGVVDRYWRADTTAGRTGLSDDFSLATYKDTLRTVLTSPSGFFRRIDYDLTDAAIFTGINLLVFTLLAVLSHTILNTVLGSPLPEAATAALSTGLQGALNHPLLAVLGLLYAYLPLKILMGGEGTLVQTLVVHLYASAVLVLSWIPFLGSPISLYAFFMVYQGYKETHHLTGTRAALVLLIPLLALLVLNTMALITIFTGQLALFGFFGGI